MHVAIVQLLVWFCVLILVFGTLTSFCVKFFAPSLSYGQAWLVSAVAMSVMTVLMVFYYIAKRQLELSPSIDGLASLVVFCIAGTSITRQLSKHGIKKTSWLGVGGRSILGIFAIAWACVIVYLAIEWVTS